MSATFFSASAANFRRSAAALPSISRIRRALSARRISIRLFMTASSAVRSLPFDVSALRSASNACRAYFSSMARRAFARSSSVARVSALSSSACFACSVVRSLSASCAFFRASAYFFAASASGGGAFLISSFSAFCASACSPVAFAAPSVDFFTSSAASALPSNASLILPRSNDAIADMRFDMYVTACAATSTIVAIAPTVSSIIGTSLSSANASKPTARFNASMIARLFTIETMSLPSVVATCAMIGVSRTNSPVMIGSIGDSPLMSCGRNSPSASATACMTMTSGSKATPTIAFSGSMSIPTKSSIGVSTAVSKFASGPDSFCTISTIRPPIFSRMGASGVRTLCRMGSSDSIIGSRL